MRTLAPLAATLLLVGCQAPLATSLQDATLQRQSVEGPYLAGATEHFLLNLSEGAKVRWGASSGALTARNTEVEWTLVEGFTTLTATLTRADGQSESREWHFQVEPAPTVGSTSAREALLATPIQVQDGGVETSGRACDVQYDGAGNAHIAFTTSTHPSVMYGKFNGTAWTIEVVDGLGFNVGGRVDDSQIRLQVESNGTPHLLYVRALAANQLWYATKSGATWTRERVDTDLLRTTGRIALALNGTARPHAVYTSPAVANDRLTVAVRNGANSWTQNQFVPTLTGATSYERLQGDAVFVGSNLVFPFISSVAPSQALASWTSGTTAAFLAVTTPGVDTQDMDLAAVSGTRLLARSRQGVFDFAVNATFNASTFTWSPSTIYGAEQGDLAWNGTRPVVMQELSGTLDSPPPTPRATGCGPRWAPPAAPLPRSPCTPPPAPRRSATRAPAA